MREDLICGRLELESVIGLLIFEVVLVLEARGSDLLLEFIR